MRIFTANLTVTLAGIYFHIPFCKKACYYCDFHFSTSVKYRDELMQCMHKELLLRKGYLQGETIETIYFGGGTPSVLEPEEIRRFIDRVSDLFAVASDAEITMEANPDDLNAAKVSALRKTPVNRFSIGIQSFFDEDLLWMNRAHTASEADSSIKRVQDAGFENITVDLIYGFPLLTNEKWKSNIYAVLGLGVPHVSAYSMTVEDRTALAHFIKKGKQPAMDDSQSAEQFVMLMDILRQNGFEHYEISNFAKPGMYSKHNTSYWKGAKYLGIGPSAHSYNGNERSWNIANNARYIADLTAGVVPSETEVLSIADRVNEYIMTGLRTMWGMNLAAISRDFGQEYRGRIEEAMREFSGRNMITVKDDLVTLTDEGKLFADHIASELFIQN